MKNFYVGIKAVIINNKKALVLKKIRDGVSIYDLPGGRINKGELIDEALKRELNEEIGLKKFTKKEIITAFERQEYEKEGVFLMLIVYKVEAKITKIKLSAEHTGYEWISKDDLRKIAKNTNEISPGIVKAINLVI